MSEARPIVEVSDLCVAQGGVTELDRLSFKLAAGEALIVLGDAASGKDALLRVLDGTAGRSEELSGTITYGEGRCAAGRQARQAADPQSSISPARRKRRSTRMPASASQLARVLARRHGGPRSSAAEELRIALERFADAPAFAELNKRPGALGAMSLTWALLAATIAQAPDLLIADHAFADLTPTSIRTVVAALMAEQARLGFGLIYAARGLKTAAHLKGRMIVLRQGRIIEEGTFDKLASGQSHAYTRTLFKALPKPSDAPPSRTGRVASRCCRCRRSTCAIRRTRARAAATASRSSCAAAPRWP